MNSKSKALGKRIKGAVGSALSAPWRAYHGLKGAKADSRLDETIAKNVSRTGYRDSIYKARRKKIGY